MDPLATKNDCNRDAAATRRARSSDAVASSYPSSASRFMCENPDMVQTYTGSNSNTRRDRDELIQMMMAEQ
jgi:hypothetical protein